MPGPSPGDAALPGQSVGDLATVLVAIGISLTVYLVVETLIGGTVAAVLAALNAGWFAWFWFGPPLSRRAASG